ncbi:Gfo/Idh/MocA family oxidoreductase [Lactococcus laudensis]|uniref:Gfo/Idh/MocA family oxidoreductase n=1 Tax=Pseudolactococcus laudensis TaxID=1494461 RepID=A0A7V8N0L3_9LACT|nr:Gfo/Idh/MocA family oxidoreductase [Lactococcus laudensis]MBA0016510.1 Gfo/Idh/MocA family oxidoreductase [Lactococcus laudensis]MBW9281247.1 gfo/Idh/MocA family oxidoreductase [Lactococcus laudensis]
MTAINIVIIGYGGMGSYHQKELMPHELVNVIGVYDIAQKAQDKAREAGLTVYDSLEQVLKDASVEAVLIATPNDVHKALSIAALRAGKQVICEKPVAMNVGELDDILAVAAETGNTFMVHQNRRWDPDFLVIRELYQNGQIGDLFQIESRVQGANGIPGDWREQAEHGGGMLLDWGVHLIDQILWLIDNPVKSMAADFSYVLGQEVDDGFILYLTFENGIRSLIEVGTTNYSQLPRWYVKGLNGAAKIDNWDLSGEIVVATNQADLVAPAPIKAGVGLTKTMAPPSEEATKKVAITEVLPEFPSFYQNFYDVLRNGAAPIVKNDEVRKVLSLIDSVFDLVKS